MTSVRSSPNATLISARSTCHPFPKCRLDMSGRRSKLHPQTNPVGIPPGLGVEGANCETFSFSPAVICRRAFLDH